MKTTEWNRECQLDQAEVFMHEVQETPRENAIEWLTFRVTQLVAKLVY